MWWMSCHRAGFCLSMSIAMKMLNKKRSCTKHEPSFGWRSLTTGGVPQSVIALRHISLGTMASVRPMITDSKKGRVGYPLVHVKTIPVLVGYRRSALPRPYLRPEGHSPSRAFAHESGHATKRNHSFVLSTVVEQARKLFNVQASGSATTQSPLW